MISNSHKNEHLQSSFNLYGEENFEFKLIKACKIRYLDRFERLFIRVYKTRDKNYGYNSDSGGNINKKRSKETVQKIAEANRGKKHTEETIERLRQANTRSDIPNGHVLYKEYIESLKNSDELGEKYNCSRSSILKRIHDCGYTINPWSGERNGMYGKHHTEETKKKIGEKSKKRRRTDIPEGHNLYKEWLGGSSCEELGLKYNCSRELIRKEILSEGYSFEDKIQSPYTLWNASKVHYKKGNMIKKDREPNPCRCFALRYNGKDINIGGFLDYYTVELINDLIENLNN